MENFENNKKYNKETDKIKSEIKDLNDSLKEIQNKCNHKDGYTVKYLQNKKVCRVCNQCDKDIGYVSTDELKSNGFI
jgi:hypothetical protein